VTARDPLPDAVVYGMPNETYHSLPALGSSGLKLLRKSPAHYFGNVLDPRRPQREATPAMAAGTLAHCATLEPDKLASRYVIKPESLDMRTKEGKAWAASVDPLLTIISAEQMQTAQRQADAIRALPEIGPLFERGHAEVSAFWTDAQTGVACKCRPDFVAPAGDGVLLLDVKTAKDADPAGFARAVWNWGYHLQAAWYMDGYAAASGLPVLGFVFLAVEQDYPHCAAAYTLDDETLQQAREENRRLLDLYAQCKRSNEWPGYPSGVGILRMPAWAKSTNTTQE
jgi:PDDEXK-like domain of unknown function (DUF3799)